MKQLLMTALLSFSSLALAKTPATTLVGQFLKSGTYLGQYYGVPCQATVAIEKNSVTFSVQTRKSYDYIAVLDHGVYSTDEKTGVLAASTGVTTTPGMIGFNKNLYFKASDSEVIVSIYVSAVDHKG